MVLEGLDYEDIELDTLESELAPPDGFEDREYDAFYVDSLLELLDEDVRPIVKAYFSLDDEECECWKLDIIGTQFGLEPQKVKRIIEKSVDKIRTTLEKRISRKKAHEEYMMRWYPEPVKKDYYSIDETLEIDYQALRRVMLSMLMEEGDKEADVIEPTPAADAESGNEISIKKKVNRLIWNMIKTSERLSAKTMHALKTMMKKSDVYESYRKPAYLPKKNWYENNFAIKWIKVQCAHGVSRKDILNEYNRYFRLGYIHFGGKRDGLLSSPTLLKWLKDLAAKEPERWHEVTKYNWVYTGNDIDELQAEVVDYFNSYTPTWRDRRRSGRQYR